MSTGVTVRGYGYAEFRAVAPPEGGKGEASPLWVYGKIGKQLIC